MRVKTQHFSTLKMLLQVLNITFRDAKFKIMLRRKQAEMVKSNFCFKLEYCNWHSGCFSRFVIHLDLVIPCLLST